jgi:aminotransferase
LLESTARMSSMALSYPRSQIRAMFDLSAVRPDVVSLAIGEPSFHTPAYVRRAAIESILAGETRYDASAGIAGLRNAVAETYSARWGLPVEHRNVMITGGAMQALQLSLLLMVEPGSEVLVPDPCFPNYLGQIHAVGARAVPIPVREEEGYRLRAADVAERITDRTSAIVLNSPSNPLGTVMDDDDVLAMVDLARHHGLTVISDEVYEQILFDGRRHVSAATLAGDLDHVIVVSSLSKSHAMTGWRLGWAIAAPPVVAVMAEIQEGTLANLPVPIQRAGIAALTGPQDELREMVDAYQRRRDLVVATLRDIPGVTCAQPAGAFYALPDFSAYSASSASLALDLLEHGGVAVTPGSAFGQGGEGHLRLAFAGADAEIAEALSRLHTYILRRGPDLSARA